MWFWEGEGFKNAQNQAKMNWKIYRSDRYTKPDYRVFLKNAALSVLFKFISTEYL